jgi:CheY-like chemotaxis protein
VKHIVDAHGGTIVVHSDGPGSGTMFEVWLPVDRAPVGTDVRGSRPAAGSPLPDEDSMLSGITVLVVDDDEDVLEALGIVLSDRGARVLTAAGVDEALRLIDAEPLDILVSDIGMPAKDGYDLIRAVRSREAQLTAEGAGVGRMPAIAHTSFSREQDVEQGLAAGFDAHCAKPLRPLPLLREMCRLLGRD